METISSAGGLRAAVICFLIDGATNRLAAEEVRPVRSIPVPRAIPKQLQRLPEKNDHKRAVNIKVRVLQIPEQSLLKLWPRGDVGTKADDTAKTPSASEKNASTAKKGDELSATPLGEKDTNRFVEQLKLVKNVDIVGQPQVGTVEDEPASIEIGTFKEKAAGAQDDERELISGMRFKAVAKIIPDNRIRVAIQFDKRWLDDNDSQVIKFNHKADFKSGETRVILLNQSGAWRTLAIMTVELR